MAMKMYNESSIAGIADRIRAKNGGSDTYTVSQMAGAIDSLSVIEDTAVYCQVNPVASEYLSNVTYDPADYSSSQIGYYAEQTTSYRKDQPAGVSVPVKKAGEIVVTDSTRGVSERANVGTGAKAVYNLTPGTVSGYWITENNDVVQAGGLFPTGALRMIRCPNARNVRDLGGWPCDGGTVKYGRLLRGGGITAADRSALVEQCGVRHELDLRAASEAGRTASILGADVKYHVYDRSVMYSLSDTEIWRNYLSVIFSAAVLNEPVYFHCSMGADRTGTVACILEALLGVSQSDIDKEYELSSFHTLRARNGNYQGGSSDWVHLISAISSFSGSTFRDKAVSFVISLGFSVDEINAFRTAMIDGSPAMITVPTASVSGTYTGCATSNDASAAALYRPYTATVTPNSGYVLEGAAVTVLMGGADITSSAYSGGTISIASVTGNIVISVAAVQDVPDNLFVPSDSVDRARINSSGSPVAFADGQLATGFINAVSGDIIYIESDKAQNTNSYTGSCSCYQSDGTFIPSNIGHTATTVWHWSSDYKKGYIVIPSILNAKNYSACAKIRLVIAYTNTASIVVNKLSTPPVIS